MWPTTMPTSTPSSASCSTSSDLWVTGWGGYSWAESRIMVLVTGLPAASARRPVLCRRRAPGIQTPSGGCTEVLFVLTPFPYGVNDVRPCPPPLHRLLLGPRPASHAACRMWQEFAYNPRVVIVRIVTIIINVLQSVLFGEPHCLLVSTWGGEGGGRGEGGAARPHEQYCAAERAFGEPL